MPQNPTGQLPEQPKSEIGLEEFEEKARERFGVPKPLWEAVKGQESAGGTKLESPTGVKGRWMVTQDTARAYGLDRNDDFHQAVAAAKNLREGYDRYKNQFDDDNKRWLAASAYYYYGPDAVKPDGTFATGSKDGLSNPSSYVTGIAQKWKAFNDGQPKTVSRETAADQMSRGLLPGTEEPRPQTARQSPADRKTARISALTGQLRAMEDFASRGDRDSARRIATDLKRRFGDLVEIKEVAGAFGVNPKRGVDLKIPSTQEAPRPAAITSAEYNALPWYQRRLRDVQTGIDSAGTALADTAMNLYDAGGSALSGDFRPLKEQAEGAGRGLLKLASAFDPVNAEETYKAVSAEQDPAIAALQARQANRRANDPYWIGSQIEKERIAAEEAAAPGFTSAVTRGLTSGAIQAPLYVGASMLGGVPASAGLAAAQSDFTRPEQAAVNIAGAVAPVYAGRALTPAITRVAGQLPGKVVPALARAAGQIGVGGGANVAQAALAGERDPSKLAEQFVVGGTLSSVDALQAARGGATKTPGVTEPVESPDATTTPAQPTNGVRVFRQGEQVPPRTRNERQIAIDISKPDGSTETVMAIAPRGMKEAEIRLAAEKAASPVEQAQPTFDEVIADSQGRIEQSLKTGDTNAADIELSVLDQTIKDQYNDAVKAAKGNPAARAAAQRIRAGQLKAVDALKQQAEARVNELAQPTEALPEQPQTEPFTPPTEPLTEPLVDEAATQRALPIPPVFAAPTDRLATQRVRTPQGGLMVGAGEAPKSPLLLGPAETQQIPGVPRTISAADEPTGRFDTVRTPVVQRQSTALPRSARAPELAPQAPQAQQSQRFTPVANIARQTAEIPRRPQAPLITQEPTNRIKSGEGSELPRQASQRLEGQPIELPRQQPNVPRATPENIGELETRYEQMLRARHDKGAPLTGEIAQEEQALGSEIARYYNNQARAAHGNRFDPDSEPPYSPRGPERPITPEERAARKQALQPGPRRSGLLQASRPGQPVTQETQIPPSIDPRTAFYSREDARRGYFDTLTDDELVSEISRLEDVKANAIRGRARLSPEETEANNFDLKIAVNEQKERGRIQRQQGVEPGQRIATRTPGRVNKSPRTIQHEQFGEVVEAADQKGVPRGKMRVTDTTGAEHVIQNPRVKGGNRVAAFVKRSTGPIPPGAMPELQGPNAPKSKLNEAGKALLANAERPKYAIPDEAMPELRDRRKQGFSVGKLEGESEGGTVLGGLGGSLQDLFKNRQAPKSNPSKSDVESASLGKAIGNILRTGAQAQRTIKTAFDLSAPLGQAAFLTIPHPLQGGRAFGKMIKSLSKTQSEAIDAEIAFHPLRKLWQKAGMETATDAVLKGDPTGGEEMFAVEKLNRVPGLSHSERTFRTYVDLMRIMRFEQGVKSLQSEGKTWDNNPKAYKDLASWINIASGRGQLTKGGKLDKAMALGGDILFSPRNFVAKFQRLDPVRYARMEPTARKLALRDALTTFGTMLTTAALFQARGSSVSFNPESDDFMIVKSGNTKYDLTLGMRTPVQFLARTLMGSYRKWTGEGNLPNKDPLNVASSFMRNQLAPGPSLAISALSGKDATGEKFADQSYGKIAREIAAPMLVNDLIEAYQQEGKAGMVKTLPSVIGARVSTYPDRAKADWVSTPSELRSEQKRAGETRTFLSPRKARPDDPTSKDETPGQFKARKAVADEWTTKYGLGLVKSQAYQSASPEEQKAAREYLKQTIVGQSDEQRPKLYLLSPGHIFATVRQSAREKQRKAARKAL